MFSVSSSLKAVRNLSLKTVLVSEAIANHAFFLLLNLSILIKYNFIKYNRD